MDDARELRVPMEELDFDEDLVHSWRGRPFTGTAYEDAGPRGRSELTFCDGLQDGPSRDWDASGRLRGESMYRQNVRHGVSREYDEAGRLQSEAVHEYSIEVRRRRWDRAGNLVESAELGPDSPVYPVLERHRREKGWPV
jgi:antitoxin component YwqK of YwqJK toxin-antitoxin module